MQHTGDHDPPRLRRAREVERDRYQQRGPASLKDIPARTFSAELAMHKELISRLMRLLVLNLSPVNLNMSCRFGINKY